MPSAAPSLPPRNPDHHPLRLLEAARNDGRPFFIQAPMVRYSKLPFRALVLSYGVDLAYTPMMLAKEFVRSPKARASDFTTSVHDRPVIIQFAARTALDFARAAEMAMPYVDGVDLNCGCPQSWAVAEGVGCAMMRDPEKVADMVRAVKERCGSAFCVSVKIRVHADVAETVRFVKVVEKSGVDYITVHGRTRTTRSSVPVDLEAIRRVKEAASVPVFANGDVMSLEDAYLIAKVTGVDGVMAARGLMTNPALFQGFERTPWGAVERFLHYAMIYNIPFRLTQHHLSEMMERMQAKRERTNMVEQCTNIVELIDWLDERYVVRRIGEHGFGEAIDIERKDPE